MIEYKNFTKIFLANLIIRTQKYSFDFKN